MRFPRRGAHGCACTSNLPAAFPRRSAFQRRISVPPSPSGATPARDSPLRTVERRRLPCPGNRWRTGRGVRPRNGALGCSAALPADRARLAGGVPRRRRRLLGTRGRARPQGCSQLARNFWRATSSGAATSRWPRTPRGMTRCTHVAAAAMPRCDGFGSRHFQISSAPARTFVNEHRISSPIQK
jgi:hypothetical protein